jgi:glutathione-regulated potassium-efflux system ancillary protein KefC
LSAAALDAVAIFFDLSPALAIVIDLGLAPSSTAFVLQTLAERDKLKGRHGRAAFAILLFQDIAAIPMLAIIPLLATPHAAANSDLIAFSIAKVAAVLAVVIVDGYYLLSPILKVVAATRARSLPQRHC